MFLRKRLPLAVVAGISLGFLTHCAEAPSRPAPSGPKSEIRPNVETLGAVTGQVTGRLVVLFASDLHGQLRGDSVRGGGYARLATVIQKERQRAAAEGHTNVLAILGGDAAGKSGLPCRKTGEKECFPLLKDVGFDVAILGNGELKRAIAELNELVQLSHLPWIGTNVEATHGNHAAWAKGLNESFALSGIEINLESWTIAPSPGEIDWNKAGFRVGATPTARDWDQWKRLAASTPVLWVTHQRMDDDLTLLGAACANLGAKNLALLQAHSHLHREDRSQCVPIFEPGPFGEYLSRLVFEKAADSALTLVSHEFIKVEPQTPEDSGLKARIDELYRKYAPDADFVVADAEANRSREDLGQWLANTIKKVSQADLAIVNLGSIKLGIDAGPVTQEKLLTAIPYSSPLMGSDISYSDLSRALCQAYTRTRSPFDDEGSELILAGGRLVNPGTPECKLEMPKRARVKVVVDSYLVKRSPRWLGLDLAPRSFKFGLDTNQAMFRGLALGGKKL